MHSLIKSTSILSIFITAYIFEYFFNAILAQNMTARDYGDISIIFKIAELFIPFILLGFKGAIIKLLPPLLDKDNKEESSRFLSAVFNKIVSRLLIVFSFCCAGTFFTSIMDTTILEKENFHYPVLLAFYLIPLLAIILIFNKVMICHKRYLSAIFISHVIRYGLCAFFVFMVFKNNLDVNFYGVFSVILMSYVMVIMLQSIYIFPIIKENGLIKRNNRLDRSWIDFSYVYMRNEFAGIFLVTIDLMMLNILGSENSTAYFKAIVVISSVLLIVLRASGSFFSPAISQLFHYKDFKKLQKNINKVFVFDLIILLVAFIIINSNTKLLLGYFGKSYQHLTVELSCISIGMIILSLNTFLVKILVYTNGNKANMKLNVFTIPFAIILGIIFIPLLGLRGAILSFTLTNMSQMLIRLYLIKKSLPIKPFVII